MHRPTQTLVRLSLAASIAVVALSLAASAVFAGEITGNGKSLHVTDSKWGTGLHARSFCAFSGQEDDQFPPVSDPTAGHSQSWGQIPHDARQAIPKAGTPGRACNPNYGPPPEP